MTLKRNNMQSVADYDITVTIIVCKLVIKLERL
jgi:hypothetical protein